MKIYVIMMLEKLEIDADYWYPDFGSTSIVGWYKDKDVAFEDVVNNALDIRECAYDYALIEESEEGLYTSSRTRWFFKWNDEKQIYEQIEEPKFLHHFSGFII